MTDGTDEPRIRVLEGTGIEAAAAAAYFLCRCGGSSNKPFCDGSHWYMGFKHEMGAD
jgi:CDGSH-type Zn-finger protein